MYYGAFGFPLRRFLVSPPVAAAGSASPLLQPVMFFPIGAPGALPFSQSVVLGLLFFPVGGSRGLLLALGPPIGKNK